MSAARRDARPPPAILAPGEASCAAAGPHAGDGSWLTPLRRHWTRAAHASLQRRAAVVRVTVAALAGSAPREPGATLLVDEDGIEGTIGGGRLEWLALCAARELLRGGPAVRLAEWILGPQLGQCCGGRVTLWLERLTRDDANWLGGIGGADLPDRGAHLAARGGARLATQFRDGAVERRLLPAQPGCAVVTLERAAADRVTLVEDLEPPRPRLWVFGAGHVGQALIRVLADVQAFDLTWIDSRAAILPRELPDRMVAQTAAAPAELVPRAAAATRYLVMTHDHALDYSLCRAILGRGDAAWLGLIGSASKAARFRSRLLRDGISRAALRTLTCPIGVAGITHKQPAAIAIAIAADLLQRLGGTDATAADRACTPAVASAATAAPADGCGAGACATCGTGVT